MSGGEPWATRLLAQRDQSKPFHCPSYKLPAYGIIELAPGNFITLDSDAFFRPSCNGGQHNGLDDTTGITSIADIRDPFHASITPQAYATGAATVIAWMLVIMLIITPRTFFVGNATGRSGLMGRRGMISGATGGGSIIGVGSRPWLQKVAALTVAISLTLATADTFKIAGRQYREGFIDAMELRDQVVAGMEIKVSRIISDIFIWLAQVQTLIRLFPRHKEKVIIKWVGFALILLDITFSSLNSFGPYENNGRPVHFETAIPALSYLFQLSLSMLYAAWVMYYAITKRRYAFYHSMMWNMSVVALLSIIAILTPVVFFITDIANYTIAGWGDYFRWVGAAAASVIVWEWVERIEALEREERKDGILGREIYDGDDMLAPTPSSSESRWPSKRDGHGSQDEKKTAGGGGFGGLNAFTTIHADRINNLAHRLGRKMSESPRAQARQKRSIHIPAPAPALRRSESATRVDRSSRTYVRVQTPPPVPVISSPVSRTDTTSADSTVYTVRYHPISETPPVGPPNPESRMPQLGAPQPQIQQRQQESIDPEDPERGSDPSLALPANKSKWHWQAVANTFRRHGRTPPQELQRGRVIEPLAVDDVTANIPPRNYTGLALADRLGTFAAQQGERFRSRKKAEQQGDATLPVTIIPAQPRGQTWSPDIVQQQQQPTQQDELPATNGFSLARVPTAIEEEEAQSPTPSTEANNSSDSAQHSSSPAVSDRNPHIRFAPASDVLGSRVADTESPPVAPTGAAFQPSHTITSTNHDR
ncbi:PalH/RIM21-domain-containing protein [Phaeosphaeria sp. MPI-PUGE-AT-0046c]|nr:PalH/RIM21-domain-containing protein [Phaeosphaeria sp. MPI-PUGE-AT-0046c]